jgi:HEAT repeat protein
MSSADSHLRPSLAGWTLGVVVAVVAAGCGLTPAEIRGLGDQGKIEELSGLLEDDRGWVREEAILALGRGGRPEAPARLAATLQDNGERAYVRAAAAVVLGQIHDPASFDGLVAMAAAQGLSPEIKLAVVEALCRFPLKDQAVRAITPLTHDEDLLVSALAEARVRSRCQEP